MTTFNWVLLGLFRRRVGQAVRFRRNDIEKHPDKYAHACDGKKLATCFYEPSTRTRLSFEAAMLKSWWFRVLGFARR